MDRDSFSDLIVATDLPMAEAFQLLQICIHSRIIVPTSTYYKIPMDLIASDQTPFDLTDDNIWKLATLCSYKFYHDSICTHIIKIKHQWRIQRTFSVMWVEILQYNYKRTFIKYWWLSSNGYSL